jgi:hypothetical protein
MRPFEWAMLATAALAVWTGSRLLLWPLAAAVGGHLLFEWPRVQLALSYPVIGWALWNLCACASNAASAVWAPFGWAIAAAAVALAISAAFGTLMPIGRFDALLTGPYKRLGVLRHTFVEGQPDSGSEAVARVRSRAPVHPPNPPYAPFPTSLDVSVKVYYPSDVRPVSRLTRLLWSIRHALTCRSGVARPDAYSDLATAQGLAYFTRLPSPLFAVFSATVTPQALRNAPVTSAQRTFPVVLFNHGLGGAPDVYTTVAQDMASHGYIVVLPSFLDTSAATAVHADGRRVRYRRLTPAEDKDEATRSKLRFAQVSYVHSAGQQHIEMQCSAMQRARSHLF